MTTDKEIKHVFEYYEVPSGVDSIFGNWVVSEDADVINVERKYPIYTQQVKSQSIDYWLDHMREKTWFNSPEEKDFIQAYERAEEILGK